MMNDKTVGGVHWSFWAIGAVGLIFNLMGCMNFVSQMNTDMVASMPEGYRALVESRPAWATGVFAIAVFGGALGKCGPRCCAHLAQADSSHSPDGSISECYWPLTITH